MVPFFFNIIEFTLFFLDFKTQTIFHKSKRKHKVPWKTKRVYPDIECKDLKRKHATFARLRSRSSNGDTIATNGINHANRFVMHVLCPVQQLI
jgi:hypothetical protein